MTQLAQQDDSQAAGTLSNLAIGGQLNGVQLTLPPIYTSFSLSGGEGCGKASHQLLHKMWLWPN